MHITRNSELNETRRVFYIFAQLSAPSNTFHSIVTLTIDLLTSKPDALICLPKSVYQDIVLAIFGTHARMNRQET